MLIINRSFKHIIFLLTLALSFVSCKNTDIDNATIKGYVYEENTENPIQGAKLVFENAYYEGGDFDGYGGYDNDTIFTDEKGYFSISFRKSAYVQLDVSKVGYSKLFKEVYTFKKEHNLKIFLEKK